ncbi:MAG: hypothetical protein WA117_23650, partial [Verrucomicrobiia bacterium]
QLEAGTFRFRDPQNQERRFIPLRLDDVPIKGFPARFLYINLHPISVHTFRFNNPIWGAYGQN